MATGLRGAAPVAILCVVHDGVQTVSYGKDGAVVKLSADGGLNQLVCFQIYSCCGFIQDQDFGLPEKSSSQT